MATLAQKIACEQKTRALLEQQGVPQPDAIEYGWACIRLFWNESKVCLVVDIDAPADPQHEAVSTKSDPDDP